MIRSISKLSESGLCPFDLDERDGNGEMVQPIEEGPTADHSEPRLILCLRMSVTYGEQTGNTSICTNLRSAAQFRTF